MLRLLCDVTKAALAPERTYRTWLEAQKPVGRAFWTVAVVGVLFALTSFGLAASGAVPLVPLVGRLPDENHYFWQMIFVGPGFLCAWLGASKLLLVFGPRDGRRGAFRRAAALAGPSLAVPLAIAWFPQAVQTALMAFGMSQEQFAGILSTPGVWQVLYIGVLLAAGAWAVLLFAAAASVSRPSGRLKSVLHGVFVAAVVAVPFVLFLR